MLTISGVQGGAWPAPRAGHGGAIVYPSSTSYPRFFIFAGVNSDGPLNDMHYFDIGSIFSSLNGFTYIIKVDY